MLEFYPHLDITLAVPKFFESIAKRSLSKSKRLKIINFDEAKTLDKTLPVKSFARTGFYNNLSTHMTDHAFRILTSQEVEDKYKNYLPIKTKDISIKRFLLPKKYVVIPTGFTAKVREIRPEVVNEISCYLVLKGYAPVYLGKRETYAASGVSIIGEFSDEIDFGLGIDLRDQTTILETTRIIQEASGIVGLDNGLLHIGGTTDIPIVGGFTTVNPVHRMPYRNDILGDNFYPVVLTDEELACNFCQSNNSLTLEHPQGDFRFCIYNDYQCTKLLNGQKYIDKLEEIL